MGLPPEEGDEEGQEEGELQGHHQKVEVEVGLAEEELVEKALRLKDPRVPVAEKKVDPAPKEVGRKARFLR